MRVDPRAVHPVQSPFDAGSTSSRQCPSRSNVWKARTNCDECPDGSGGRSNGRPRRVRPPGASAAKRSPRSPMCAPRQRGPALTVARAALARAHTHRCTRRASAETTLTDARAAPALPCAAARGHACAGVPAWGPSPGLPARGGPEPKRARPSPRPLCERHRHRARAPCSAATPRQDVVGPRQRTRHLHRRPRSAGLISPLARRARVDVLDDVLDDVPRPAHRTLAAMRSRRAARRRVIAPACRHSSAPFPREHELTPEVLLGGELIVGPTAQANVFRGCWPTSAERPLVMQLERRGGAAAYAPRIDERAARLVPQPRGATHGGRNMARAVATRCRGMFFLVWP